MVSGGNSEFDVPENNAAALDVTGKRLPILKLPSTNGDHIDLQHLSGCSVLYIYPMTSRPNVPSLKDWDVIPGARGCTPQSCAFRDHFAEIKALGVAQLFGLSAQATDEQREAVLRLHLPFPLLSDAKLELAAALGLPTFEVEGRTLFKRMTLIVQDGCIRHVFYPVLAPERNAQDVIDYLERHRHE